MLIISRKIDDIAPPLAPCRRAVILSFTPTLLRSRAVAITPPAISPPEASCPIFSVGPYFHHLALRHAIRGAGEHIRSAPRRYHDGMPSRLCVFFEARAGSASFCPVGQRRHAGSYRRRHFHSTPQIPAPSRRRPATPPAHEMQPPIVYHWLPAMTRA